MCESLLPALLVSILPRTAVVIVLFIEYNKISGLITTVYASKGN